MTKARVVRINSSLYVNVPADEARRLGIREGQVVEVDVKPLGATVEEVMELRGKYKGKIPRVSDRELWGEEWGGA